MSSHCKPKGERGGGSPRTYERLSRQRSIGRIVETHYVCVLFDILIEEPYKVGGGYDARQVAFLVDDE